MKLLVFSSLIALLFSCGNTKEIEVVEEATVEEPKPQRVIEMEAKVGEFKESDPLNITSARIEGNILYLEVSYSGGCKEHEFEMIASPMIIKTLPPKRTIQLYHNANEDVCREFVTTRMAIDLQGITVNSASGSENILLLQGWDDPLTYIFE